MLDCLLEIFLGSEEGLYHYKLPSLNCFCYVPQNLDNYNSTFSVSRNFKISSLISTVTKQWLLSHILFSLHMLIREGNYSFLRFFFFFFFYLWLISCLITLWLEKLLDDFSLFKLLISVVVVVTQRMIGTTKPCATTTEPASHIY